MEVQVPTTVASPTTAQKIFEAFTGDERCIKLAQETKIEWF